jgi:hypothetical protein
MHSHSTLHKVDADGVGAWFQTHLVEAKLNYYSYGHRTVWIPCGLESLIIN